jgi:flagellar assembly protein FliH
MTRALHLEEFGSAEEGDPVRVQSPPPPPTDPVTDDGGLAAFEQGYRSGWDDCIANEQEERRRIGAGLAAALGEVSATAETVRAELLAALVPVFDQIAERFLPALAAEALIPLVMGELQAIAAAACDADVELLAAPEVCPTIEALARGVPGLDLRVVPEPAFADGQASLRFAGKRRDIDLSEAAASMAEAFRDFTGQWAQGSSNRAEGFDASPDLSPMRNEDDLPRKGVA